MYYDRPTPARCFTGTVCSLGFVTLVLSMGFFANCISHPETDACNVRFVLTAVYALICGLILITLGGICLAVYDCFQIEPTEGDKHNARLRQAAYNRITPP